jgi:hypothetical protein
VFTSADLIEVLRRRARRSLRPETEPGEFPPGWRAWFAAMRDRVGAITGASAEAIVAILAQRELRRPPPAGPALNPWQAFATLWRQQWRPVGPEDRVQRIVAFSLAMVLQLVFAILVLWLAYARYGGEPPAPGEEVVQVEFIGQGTPREEGGGAPAGAQPQPQAPAAASARPAPRAAARTRAEPVAAAPAAATAAPPAQPQPQPPVPAEAAQPLQATVVAEPDIPFVVPPPLQRAVVVPRAQVDVPRLLAQPEALPSPAPSPSLPAAVAREVQVRPGTVQVPGLAQQAEALPAPGPPLPGASTRAVEVHQGEVRVPGLSASVASLPSPSPAAGGDGVGAGPKPAATAGAWSSPLRGDDWGASDRNRPGGQAGASGLFDENGRPRLPPGTGAHAGGGLPPGVVSEDIANLDRAGTWLKRSPIKYSPTAFDRYWMPGGTLLEEWVRRGVREVQIRIPGTTKEIHCVVSLLALGGACGVDDPNMQDQEAEARPPPDIPWKPELQEK